MVTGICLVSEMKDPDIVWEFYDTLNIFLNSLNVYTAVLGPNAYKSLAKAWVVNLESNHVCQYVLYPGCRSLDFFVISVCFALSFIFYY